MSSLPVPQSFDTQDSRWNPRKVGISLMLRKPASRACFTPGTKTLDPGTEQRAPLGLIGLPLLRFLPRIASFFHNCHRMGYLFSAHSLLHLAPHLTQSPNLLIFRDSFILFSPLLTFRERRRLNRPQKGVDPFMEMSVGDYPNFNVRAA